MGKRKMLWKALSVVVGVILLTWGGSSKAERNVVASRRMNNFVTELLNVKIAASPHSKHEFSNPRDGWVFFSTTVDKSSSTEIRVSIEKMTGKNVVLEHEQDPSLIGGIVTRIGDLVLDGSIKTQLLNMRESLKRGERV